MPNIEMPDGVVVAFPDTMPKEQIRSLVASKFPEMFEPEGNEFTRGVKRGTATAKALVTEGLPLSTMPATTIANTSRKC